MLLKRIVALDVVCVTLIIILLIAFQSAFNVVSDDAGDDNYRSNRILILTANQLFEFKISRHMTF